MRTTPANDLRVTKTLEAIDTTFRAMMLEKGFPTARSPAIGPWSRPFPT